MTRRSKIAKIVPIVNPSWLPFRVCSNDHAQLIGMPYIFFFKIKNCLNDDLFINSMTGLEKCCITSAYLQWLCHSGERPVARGPLVFFFAKVTLKIKEVGYGYYDRNMKHCKIRHVQPLKTQISLCSLILGLICSSFYSI